MDPINKGFRLFPDAASNFAPGVDSLYAFLITVSAIMTILIATLIIYFALKYRRKGDGIGAIIPPSTKLEIIWSVIPFGIVMIMFWWGARIFVQMNEPPPDGMEYLVVGKQWMWKIQHPTGRREINEIHVPTGRPIVLRLASEDVIHSFYLPAMRIKRDVVPGREQKLWFEATTPGEYHLFCAEYCGTNHSRMRGRIVVMEPSQYETWLSGAAPEDSPVVAGSKLFARLGCTTCHGTQAPTMAGLFGSRVQLSDGATVVADENYLRESILDPRAKIVAGYAPLMPTFQGQVSEEQLMQLIAFIKSLAFIDARRPEPQ